MEGIFSRIEEVFGPERIVHYLLGKLLPDLIVAGLTFLAFWLLWRAILKGTSVVLERVGLDMTARRFLQTVLRYLVLGLGVVTALAQLGIDMGSVLTSLGVAGLTLGFAAKDALSNIISGLFIFWDRPFVLGDLVEVGGRYGRVAEITMRSTRVVTVDGKMLAVPNTEVINSTVVSYTNFPNLRIDLPFTVGVDADIDRVRSVALSVIAGDGRYMAEPAPTVVMTALGDYNNGFELRAWINEERGHLVTSTDLRERVYRALYTAGIDMPTETLTLRPIELRQVATA